MSALPPGRSRLRLRLGTRRTWTCTVQRRKNLNETSNTVNVIVWLIQSVSYSVKFLRIFANQAVKNAVCYISQTNKGVTK